MFVRVKRGFRVLYLFAGVLSLLLFAALLSGVSLAPSLEVLPKVLLGMVALIFGIGAIALIYDFSSRVFGRLRLPPASREGEPIYGFSNLLVIGLGSTMGASMLTVLPYAIHKFSSASTMVALLFSGAISVMFAKSYGSMYRRALANEKEIVGGPGFVKESFGIGATYFVSRVSMWLGNTALASFNAIVFYKFAFDYMPGTFSLFGGKWLSFFGLALVLSAFTSWLYFLLRYEKREKVKVIAIQSLFLGLFLGFLLISAYFLFVSPGEFDPLRRVLELKDPSNVIFTAGYIYLVLFGFQEIQAMVADAKPEISVFGRKVSKGNYIPMAMMATVLITIPIFLIYAFLLSKFHLFGDIPPLEIAKGMGRAPVALNSALFMIASLTTLVPAYLAASRHLSELARDGMIPRKVTPYSWLFTLLTLGIMVVMGPDFLIEITDTCILISLLLIAVSEFEMGEGQQTATRVARITLTAITCLAIVFSFYFLKPQVFIYGVSFIVISWFVFTLLGIGRVLNLFFSILCLMSYAIVQGLGLEIPSPATWLAHRMGVLLLFVGAIYFINFVLSVDLRALSEMIWNSFLDFFLVVSSRMSGVVSAAQKRIGRERVRTDKYRIMELALRLEELKEKDPKLYERLKPILERDLTRLEEVEGA